ncbi:hypothetical protein BGZ46_002566 [Entomortierella lignicola]|nr:hypothetical protein BGZ46_002566 [Entomortierella lignicola]
MDGFAPMIMGVIEKHARPHVQEKVTEELGETKVELKQELPGSIVEHIQGPESNPMIAQVADSMGDKLIERIKSVTDVTVETASEGMDLLLTDGVMNIARGIIMKHSEENGKGFNLDFFHSGKEGMVQTTMAASAPVIKQVSGNISRKISAHIPASIGGAIQEIIDEHGGASGPLGLAAGLLSKFMGEDGPGEETVAGGGTEKDVEEVGGHTGGIQKLLQNILAPKILLWIQPYMQKFEAKMTTSLEGELRSKVFSVDYLKEHALTLLTGMSEEGGEGGLGGLIGSFFQHKISQHAKNDDDDDESEGRRQQSGGGKQNDEADPMALLQNVASEFLKNRED